MNGNNEGIALQLFAIYIYNIYFSSNKKKLNYMINEQSLETEELMLTKAILQRTELELW